MTTRPTILIACLLALCVTSGAMRSSNAATVAHYRFETSPGFTNDSAGTRHLVNSGAAQYLLPSSGQGSTFPDPLDGGAGNTNAADFDLAADVMDTGDTGSDMVGSNFTVEAFINFESFVGPRGVIAGYWEAGANDRSFMFAVANSQVLTLLISENGVNNFTYDSGFEIHPNDDYYVAVTFSIATGLINFYVKNLDRSHVHWSTNVTHAHAVFHPTDRLNIGSVNGGESAFLGVIDEVRISDTVLDVGDLLVTDTPNSDFTADEFYFRFEDSPGFHRNSIGGTFDVADRAGSSVVQTNIPASGRGSTFPDPVPQTGTANRHAADFGTADVLDSGPMSRIVIYSNFTAEAFINPTTVSGRRAIAAMWDVGSADRSLMFSVENGDLSLFLSDDGSSFQFDMAGLTIAPNTDYFVAVTFDHSDPTSGIVFYAVDLTNGGPMMVSTASHTIASLHRDDRLTIGAVADGGNDYQGFIDEVRLSRRVLRFDEMLVSPAGGTLVLVR